MRSESELPVRFWIQFGLRIWDANGLGRGNSWVWFSISVRRSRLRMA